LPQGTQRQVGTTGHVEDRAVGHDVVFPKVNPAVPLVTLPPLVT